MGGDNALPTEIRLFKAGLNRTCKGDFIFDAQASKDVLAAFASGGVDLMIDLNHDSWDDAALAARSDAGDARGWCKLEDRGGELWAASITWTPDGQERLTSKKQRYFSPTFAYDTDTMRVLEVLNVAICAMPATFGAQPLVAANRKQVAPVLTPAALRRVVKAMAALRAKSVRHTLALQKKRAR